MKLLLIGATGPLGAELLTQGLEQGHQVTALVRNPSKITLTHPNLILAKGDVLTPASIDAVMPGQDVVVCSVGMSPTLHEVTLFSEGTRNLLNSMSSHGVRRIIAVTGIGAGDSRGHGGFLYDKIVEPTILKTIYADKDRQEQILQQSDRDWIVVRPGMLTEDPPKGSYRVLTNLEGVTAGKIARADVAAFILEQLASDAYLHKFPLITY